MQNAYDAGCVLRLKGGAPPGSASVDPRSRSDAARGFENPLAGSPLRREPSDVSKAAKKSARKRRRAAAAAVAAAANTESLSGGSEDADSGNANATGADKGADRFAQLEAER